MLWDSAAHIVLCMLALLQVSVCPHSNDVVYAPKTCESVAHIKLFHSVPYTGGLQH